MAKAPSRKRNDVASQKRDNDNPPKKKGPGSPARFKGKPRGPGLSCKMPHLTNAMKVVAKHGGRVEIMPDGRIIIIPAGQDHPTTQAGDDLDKWMAEKNARQA